MTYEEKLDKAIKYLGEKYILHPNFDVKKYPAPLYRGSWHLKGKYEIQTNFSSRR